FFDVPKIFLPLVILCEKRLVMRRLFLIVALAAVALGVLTEDASARFGRRRHCSLPPCYNAAPVYSFPAPSYSATPGQMPSAGQMPSVAGTSWTGNETGLPGYDKLSFQFNADGSAAMTDAKGSHPGNWAQNGNQVTVTLPGVAIYQGTINGGT